MNNILGVIADAHGNRPAFERAVEVLVAFGAQEFVFLGDAVGYLPSLGVLEALDFLGPMVSCVKGNHEEMLLAKRDEGEHDEVYQLATLRDQLTPAQWKMIDRWPTSLRREEGRSRLLFVHGSPADPVHGYVYPQTDLSQFVDDDAMVIMGHTHRPFIRSDRGRTYVNVGSCGLPRDDGRMGAVGLIDLTTLQARILRFDIQEQTAEALDALPHVHSSVRAVFQRRSDEVFGEQID